MTGASLRPGMRALGLLLASLAAVTAPGHAGAQETPVNNWAEFRRTVAACWTVPPGTEGSLIAYRFGLDKTGAIRGKPLITARRLTGDRDAQKSFEDSGAEVLAHCFPVRVTPSFGAVFGESPIYLRLVNTPPTAAYQINNNVTIFAPQ
ncbi:hypothetical protein [Methylobacterium aerolatum]|uniref:Uncharacterized protein n=1 Tax=Methylobacterium aerolatum TaxID=418708 RepID=A0ABU0I3K4_9HYPH|nr:hypothetical protein [Methylobacterium aerolatum]MDQ0449195.1 hypothetical protein [Methylobacterium aerolatum]GJD35382.1 hypothetical protein FMGBMHLM_2292 [Methylobacterium aerolatum]